MSQLLLKTEIKNENDIVSARKRARDLAHFLKLDNQEQTRLATAVSEIARNAYQYAKGGIIEYAVIEENSKAFISITIKDKGKGIVHLNDIQSGRYVSPEGMGVGLMGSKKLVDALEIETSSTGTTIELRKFIPLRRGLLTSLELKDLMNIFMKKDDNPLDEIQKQNHEILLTVTALNEKKEELARLNKELEETNRGVVALYAELDEKAESLRIANETKTSFLSDMTHEFRSPLNSILSISKFLLEETQTHNQTEQEKQVKFIISAAQSLSDLVNDLLDIAKIEAGKIPVRTEYFTIQDLFSTMRGLMRPIVSTNPEVTLTLQDVDSNLSMSTDEGKVSQMLRNLISNAIKYTEKGEIIVSAKQIDYVFMEISVQDTGIGISPENIDSIFSEFVQIENSQQDKNKGTGLGLPLTKKLATLLGGNIYVESTPGVGSTFKIRIPSQYHGPKDGVYKEGVPEIKNTPTKLEKILIVDDEEVNRYQLARLMDRLELQHKEAQDGTEALELAFGWKPDLVILDLVMPKMNGFDYLRESLGNEDLRKIPIILHTSKILEPEEREYLEQVTFKIINKGEGAYAQIQDALIELEQGLRK